MQNSDYVNSERRDYSLYVLQSRAIPHAADGLKAAARRVLWTGRNGAKYKSATLAGMTMPIHPHQTPEGAVNTLASPYNNNIPLLTGFGAFGTLLDPGSYGAARYTSVKVSEFTKDVVFRDIEIVPMQENYDGTLQEPKHFLPLVPITLLNPQSGIAVGFASNILPRSLPDIIQSQIDVLEEHEYFYESLPELTPIRQKAYDWSETTDGYKYYFMGEYEKVNPTTVRITNLPYGKVHSKYIEHLNKLEENGEIVEYTDNSRDSYNIEVKFKKGVLSRTDDNALLETLGLIYSLNENLNVINFDGETVWSTNYQELVTEFCDWRLKWYQIRYQRLADLLEIDIQKYKDIIKAIVKNVGGLAKKIRSRSELKEVLEAYGIVHVDYIADLSVYRFTEEEKDKVQAKLDAANVLMKEYRALLKSEPKRRMVYISELQEVLANYKKGKYE
jgi:DNA gyrase/topoisomerase IV subunit A